MSLFDKINELFPELLSEMTTQGSQQDSTQILEAEINEIEGCDISSGTELGVPDHPHGPDSPDIELLDHHIACQGCGSHIVGVRFLCASCPSAIRDYNLCAECEPKSYILHDPAHTFFKFNRPVDQPIKSPSPIVPSAIYIQALLPRNLSHAFDPEAYLRKVYHRGVLCDFCVKEIKGEWFRCVYCGKDLCSLCEKTDNHDRTHFFMVFKAKVEMGIFRSFARMDESKEECLPVFFDPVYNPRP